MGLRSGQATEHDAAVRRRVGLSLKAVMRVEQCMLLGGWNKLQNRQ